MAIETRKLDSEGECKSGEKLAQEGGSSRSEEKRRTIMAVLRRYLWISALAFGLIFLALGAFVVVKGLAAKAEIRDRLAEEQVYTSKDAVSFGVDEGVLVQDAKTAQAQADTIRLHTLERYGPYAKMAKDDPNRG